MLVAKRSLASSMSMALSFGGMSVGLLAPGAHAADAPQDQLVEIIVTAERRSESLEKTPAAIDVVTQSKLSDLGVTSALQIADIVPDVKIYSDRDSTVVYIRGVGNTATNAFADPDVTFSVDGVPLSLPSGPNGLLFDLARIEVLEGPQGTLYGRNATSGAVNIVTNDPTKDFGGSGSMTVGNYGLFQTGAVLNMPINDQLQMRAAFQTLRHEGYLSDGHDDADSYGGRFKALWTPNDNLRVLFGADLSHDSGLGEQRVPINTNGHGYYWPTVLGYGNPYTIHDNYPTTGEGGGTVALISPHSSDVSANSGFWSQIDWNLDFATLTVIPAYREEKQNWLDSGLGFGFQQDEDDKTRTLEARLASNDKPNQVFKWVGGFFAMNQTLTTGNIVQQSFPPIGSATPELEQFEGGPQVIRSYAGFFQGTYSIIPAVRFTGGIRYTADHKEETGYSTNDVTAVPLVSYTFSQDWRYDQNKVTWKARVDGDLTDNSLLYFDVSTGYKAGGYGAAPSPATNPGLVISPELATFLTYKPETITAYSLGIKNELMDRRLQIDGEVFFWKYKNQQVETIFILPVLNNLGGIVVPAQVNAGSGRDAGVDIKVNYLLTHADRLGVSIEYLDTKYSDFIYPQGQIDQLVNESGKPFNNAPAWAGNIDYSHDWNTPGGSTITGAVHSHLTSGYWISYSYIPDGDYQKSYSTTDLNLTYFEPNRRWSVGLWVRNLENKAIKLDGSGTVPGSPPDPAPPGPFLNNFPWVSLGAPRTYGASVNAKF